jgi:hypothetical protein
MRAVTKRCILGLLALAKPSRTGLFCREFLRRKSLALMRPITERLRRRKSAGAKPIVLASLEFNFSRGGSSDVWRGIHVWELAVAPHVWQCILANRMGTQVRGLGFPLPIQVTSPSLRNVC